MSEPVNARREDVRRDAPSHRVVTAVSRATGESPATLPPLYEAVDPDALDALFGENGSEASERFVFTYYGHEVTVHRGGAVTVSVEN